MNSSVEVKERYVPKVAIGLVHYPIVDKEKKIVATNITNFDIHDIARAATVYGVERYYLVHPFKEQLMFVERILDHWAVGQGSKFNPSRKVALSNTKASPSIEAAIDDWKKNTLWDGQEPIIIATHARPVNGAKAITFEGARDLLFDEKKAVFVVFGTGYGLTDEFMVNCHYVLESIRGAPPKDFRHLSVRSAVSICLDRLLGPW